MSSVCIQCFKFGTYFSITVVFFGYNLAFVLLMSCFMKVPYLLYRFKLMTSPNTNQSTTFSQIVPHFHPFPIHIHFHMDFHSTEGLYSGTKDRRGTREAAIESSRQDDSNQYLKFSSKDHVQGQGQVKGQKHGFRIFRHRFRTVNRSVPKISINAPKRKGRACVRFMLIISTGQSQAFFSSKDFSQGWAPTTQVS